MNVFYEEEGAFKVGAILADNDTSLQIEAAHGKRSKIKSAAVLLRFDQPALAAFVDAAQQVAAAVDVDFLWECCGADEFSFDTLGKEYFGHAPSAVESAALLYTLHGAPMYFYKKGRGRYRAAPAESLKSALASVEKKRLQAEQKQRWAEEIVAGRLPPEFTPLVSKLLYAPDKNALEWKAFEAACETLKLPPARVMAHCGALATPHDYHLNKFLFEYFPRGTAFDDAAPLGVPADLPLADVRAFSIDDETTTEIDDAFSVTSLANGNTEVGIHIAVPALGIVPGSAFEAVARERLSTVYFPGRKITMLPDAAIDAFTLAEGAARSVLSLYAEVNAQGAITGTRSRCELVPIEANLRIGELESVFNADTLAAGTIAHEFGTDLQFLWQFARHLQAARGKADNPEMQRTEYNFYVEDERVRIVERKRGSPIDKVVSELMIYANAEWGGQLARAGYVAIYRAQSGGVARMTTVASRHDGLGVEQYAWASSPLRRYIDLVNQRQLLALFAGKPPPYQAGDEALLAALREFELAYEAYAEFQRNMERYWCLRWLEQENVSMLDATVLRENLVRCDRLPLVIRVPSLHDVRAGDAAKLAVLKVDPWDLAIHADYIAPSLAPANVSA
ncbi:MAG: ribonuclease [Betaproteobacteria bacterium]|nr:ribonuclease [Betaproteobacteria bacterium]